MLLWFNYFILELSPAKPHYTTNVHKKLEIMLTPLTWLVSKTSRKHSGQLRGMYKASVTWYPREGETSSLRPGERTTTAATKIPKFQNNIKH